MAKSNSESPVVTTSWIFEEHPWDQRLENGAMASVVSGCRINFGVEAVPSWFAALQVRLGASLLNPHRGIVRQAHRVAHVASWHTTTYRQGLLERVGGT